MHSGFLFPHVKSLRFISVQLLSQNSFNLGVKMTPKGDIETDEFQNTSAKNIYAVGDVIGKWQLTPGNVFGFLRNCFTL
jgi:thioredoxin reductase